MRSAALLFATALAATQAFGQIKLPASGVVAGPLDDVQSSLGDDINNYPFGHGFGSGPIHGWISATFDPPSGSISHFRLRWQTVGDSPQITFANGAFFVGKAVANFPSPDQASEGDLNLATGEVTKLAIHAIFQNALIHKTARDNRFPLSSSGAKFTVLFGDYPPLVFPFPLGYSGIPTTSQSVAFVADSGGNITGINLQGTTFIPITAVPKTALMPTYSFGPQGNTIIPGADGCAGGGTQCLTDAAEPDGIDSPYNGFLSPTLVMKSSELQAASAAPPPIPPAKPGGVFAGASGVVIGSQFYVFGGFDGRTVQNQAFVFNTATNAWTGLPNMPGALWMSCATAVLNKIYMIGGSASGDGVPSSATYVFDTAASAWSTSANLPTPIREAACTTVGKLPIVFGGITMSGAPTAVVLALASPGGGWSAQPSMPTPLAGAATAIVASNLYFVGGTQEGTTATSNVLIYSTASGAWSNGPPAPRGVYGASATYLAGRLMVAGGRTSPLGPLDVGATLYQSQTTQVMVGGQWYAGLAPPVPVSGTAGFVVDNTWYLAGGDTTATGATLFATDVVQAYTPASGWVVSNTHPVFTSQTVLNSAGLGVGPSQLSPGSMASIIGNNLAPVTLNAAPVWFDGRYVTTDLPTSLGGISINIHGQPAGILMVSPHRIDFQVPFSISAGNLPRQVPLTVTSASSGFQAVPIQVSIVNSAPGIFTYAHGETAAINYLDQNSAIVYNQNGTLNYGSNPAHAGELITIRATGLGDVTPRPDVLQRASRDTVANVVNPPSVLIDGKLSQVMAAQLVPGEAGVYQIQVRIPSDTRSGFRVAVTLVSGEVSSNNAVLVIQ